MVDRSKCPCGDDKHYNDCCKPLHMGERLALTAAELMRSRYSAYVKNLADYLSATWHPSSRPEDFVLDKESGFKWLDLRIVATEKGEENDDDGFVTFTASFEMNQQRSSMQEKSRFLKEGGRWFYVDGDH